MVEFLDKLRRHLSIRSSYGAALTEGLLAIFHQLVVGRGIDDHRKEKSAIRAVPEPGSSDGLFSFLAEPAAFAGIVLGIARDHANDGERPVL